VLPLSILPYLVSDGGGGSALDTGDGYYQSGPDRNPSRAFPVRLRF